MKYLYLICRILLALVFIVFGLNGLHPFMNMPMPPANTPPGQFMDVMGHSGWLHHVSALEVLGGILVLIGGTAPLGLVILGPIIINALMFHILLAGGQGIAPALVATALEIILIYGYRSNFAGIFTYKATPTA
jgi:putative oxidoreductase